LKRVFCCVVVAVGVAAAGWLCGPAWAATLTVTSAGDTGTGSGLEGDLRYVVGRADEIAGTSTIEFAPALDGQTIELTEGEIEISKNVRIVGAGPSQLAIDPKGQSRIFDVTAPSVSISGLSLDGGATSTPEGGGAIYDHPPERSTTDLTLEDCVFENDSVTTAGALPIDGGAVAVKPALLAEATSTISLRGCTFAHDAAGGPGGEAANSDTGNGGAVSISSGLIQVDIERSTFAYDTAGGEGGSGVQSGVGLGGALRVSGISSQREGVSIDSSTFSGDRAGGDGDSPYSGAGVGGAIDLTEVNATITDSTFTGDQAGGVQGSQESGNGHGGAISTYLTPLELVSDTLDANDVGPTRYSTGANLDASGQNPNCCSIEAKPATSGAPDAITSTPSLREERAAVSMDGTVIADGEGAPGCAYEVGAYLSVGPYSIEGEGEACGLKTALPDSALALAALQNNGGPTETQAPLPESAEIGVIPFWLCPTKEDQRGLARPGSGKLACDVGAFETQDPIVGISSPRSGQILAQGVSVDARFSCSDAEGLATSGGCFGPVADGAPIETATIGRHSFTVTATSAAGISRARTIRYDVVP